jgi:hypothetical protein
VPRTGVHSIVSGNIGIRVRNKNVLQFLHIFYHYNLNLQICEAYFIVVLILHTVTLSFFQIICYQEYDANGRPEKNFYPVTCLKGFQRRNTKKKQEHCKICTQSYFSHTNLLNFDIES